MGYNSAMSDRDKKTSRRRVTLAQVAQALGVAPATVSNAYNRPSQLSPALRERILREAVQMGYHPNPAARGLRRGRSGVIGAIYPGLISHSLVDPAFTQFLRGVALVAETNDLSIALIPGAPSATRDPEVIRAAVVDGFLLYSMPDDDPMIDLAIERHMPLVCVDAPALDAAPLITIDDRAAATRIAAHLLAQGHRRIAVLALVLSLDSRPGPADAQVQATTTYRIVRERLRGYADACAAAGLDWQSVPVEVCADNSLEAATAAAARLLATYPDRTAIIGMSDLLALGALGAAAARGLRVPQDLSLVGFDDIPTAAQVRPPLTTIWQPHDEKGRLATELLLARLQGDPERPPARQQIGTRLVLRDSTAPPRT